MKSLKQLIGFGFFISTILLVFSSCKNEIVLPKQKAYLRLEYPIDIYQNIETNAYQFEIPSNTKAAINKNLWMKIEYPKLKATIHITYKPIKNNLRKLIKGAEKLTLTHAKKADDIFFDTYENPINKTYGKVGNVTGDTASAIQFYLTDSTKNFLTGTLYFNAQPNYDSIYPAIKFIKKDILHLIETTKWN